MPKLPDGELSRHQIKGFRLTSGWYAKDGRRRPKVFWLGQDKDRALLAARVIHWYQPVVNAGGEGWTPHWLAQLKATDPLEIIRQRYVDAEQTRLLLAPHLPPQVVVQGAPPAAGGSPGQPAAAVPAGTCTLHAALDAFVESVRGRTDLSPSHRKTVGDSVAALKHYQGDVPLAGVDYAFLERLAALLKDRPASRRRSRATGGYERITPYTVRRLLKHLQQGLRWLHRQRQSQRFGGWRLPEDALDLLAVDMTRLMTKAERDRAADGPRQLTAGEIVTLYRDGIGGVKINVNNDRHRLWFLLGLFAGQGQKELSTIRRDEFDLDAATLTHRRNKTSVQGVYWLPPELVEMLREHFRQQAGGDDGLAFHTGEGRPLVDDRCDAVRQAWDDWRERSKLDLPAGLGFYALRRFFGDYATRAGGDAVGDAALAHTAKSVRGKHYSGFRDFDKVREAGQRLHKELKAAGMFATAPGKKSGRGGTKGRSPAP